VWGWEKEVMDRGGGAQAASTGGVSRPGKRTNPRKQKGRKGFLREIPRSSSETEEKKRRVKKNLGCLVWRLVPRGRAMEQTDALSPRWTTAAGRLGRKGASEAEESILKGRPV